MVTSCARNNLGARLRSTWCTRNDADGGSISPEHWKVLYRAFLLRVHPDFFHDLPEERSVNEKNLQALSMHLGERDHTAIPRSGRLHGSMDSGGARLVFFLKATTTESSAIATVTDATALATDATSPATCAATPATDATAPATDATAADAAPAQAFEYDGGDDDDDHHGSNRVNRRRNGAVDHDSRISSNINGDITATTSPDYCSNGAGYGALLAPPKKVMLPLQSHRTSTKLELMHLLRAAGVTLPPEISMTPPPPARPPHRSHLHEQESTTATTPFGWDEEDNWAGMDDLFGGTWSGSRSSSRFYGASDPYQNRRYDGESAQERRRAEGGGPSATAGLGFVLETEAGRTLVRERRRSTRNVRRLVEELREQYGFGEFSFRQVLRWLALLLSLFPVFFSRICAPTCQGGGLSIELISSWRCFCAIRQWSRKELTSSKVCLIRRCSIFDVSAWTFRAYSHGNLAYNYPSLLQCTIVWTMNFCCCCRRQRDDR